jgi:HK97 family phage major capsid protein
MKFKSVAEAFNFYKGKDVKDLDARAAAIEKEINTDANADIEALNIELRGIKEAKDNIEIRSQAVPGLNIITGQGMQPNKPDFSKVDVIASPEYRSAFFKTLLGQELSDVEKDAYAAGVKEAEKRADAFTSSTDAVVVLPTQTLNEIIVKARTIGGLIANVRAFNMPTKIAVPVATPAAAASWHTEGAEVDGEKVVPTSVTFDGFEIIKVISISAKVRRMSISAFETYLVDELTACVMATIENALINGTGTNQGTGILAGVTWTANTNMISNTAISYADVVKTVALLKRGYSAGAKWVMNNAMLYNVFYGMVDSNKRPIFIADTQNGTIGKILGFDVIIDDNMPDNTALFGNFGQYMAYNLPDGIVVEVSTQSSFRKGLIDYRALAIADCKPIVTEAFVKLVQAAG